MKCLAPEKIHWPKRFLENRCRSRHTMSDNRPGHTFHQFDIFGGKRFGFRLDGEGMTKAGSQLNQSFRHATIGGQTHKRRSVKATHKRAALYEGVGGESTNGDSENA